MPKKRLSYGYHNIRVHYLNDRQKLLCEGQTIYPQSTNDKDKVTCKTCIGLLNRGYNTRSGQSIHSEDGHSGTNR